MGASGGVSQTIEVRSPRGAWVLHRLGPSTRCGVRWVACQELMKYKTVDLDSRDFENITALAKACRSGYLEVSHTHLRTVPHRGCASTTKESASALCALERPPQRG
jgi:hypothetical protein